MAEGAPSGGEGYVPPGTPEAKLPEFNPGTPNAPPNLGPEADTGYNEQAAKAWFQINNQLAGDKQTFTDVSSTYNYNRALQESKQPGIVGTQRFRAALGGFANSGTEGRDQGRIQAEYIDRQTKLLTAAQQRLGAINTTAQGQVGGYNQGLGFDIGKAQERYKTRQVKNAPQEPQAQTGFAPQAGSTVPGGGYPNIPVGPRGFATAEYGVGQGTDKPMRGTRLAAANKAKKR